MYSPRSTVQLLLFALTLASVLVTTLAEVGGTQDLIAPSAGSLQLRIRRLVKRKNAASYTGTGLERRIVRADSIAGAASLRQSHLDARPAHHRRYTSEDTLFSSSSIIAPIQVGTPPQNLWVLLDTASADLAIFGPGYAAQFKPSKNAAQTQVGPAFQTSQSSTYQATALNFTNNYGSGDTATSFTAIKARDTVAFETLILQSQPLGVIYQGDVSYGPKAAGIMGLAFESASSGLGATPVVQQLYFSGSLKQPVFTFALARPSTASELTSQDEITQPGGVFTLGIIDQQQYSGNIGWSDVVSTDSSSTSPAKWLAKIDSIQINGKTVSALSHAVANFDTGSSASRMSSTLLDALISNVANSYKDGAGNYYVPCGTKQTPSMQMTLTIGGVSVNIEPLDLLYKTERYTIRDTSGGYCTTTLSTTDSDDYDVQLGDDVLRSLFVAFQFAPAQVGIAAQSDALRAEAAPATFDFQGATTQLTGSSLMPVRASRAAHELVAAQNVNNDADTKHLSTNADGSSLARGGTLVKGQTATMEAVVASTSAASSMQARSSSTDGATATNALSASTAPNSVAASTPAPDVNGTSIDTSGINRNPTTSIGTSSASRRCRIDDVALALLTLSVGSLAAVSVLTL